jgi:hypothetical protein
MSKSYVEMPASRVSEYAEKTMRDIRLARDAAIDGYIKDEREREMKKWWVRLFRVEVPTHAEWRKVIDENVRGDSLWEDMHLFWLKRLFNEEFQVASRLYDAANTVHVAPTMYIHTEDLDAITSSYCAAKR